MSENVLPMFYSRSFMVSCLIFKCLSHFEFIFVCDVRECSNFIDLLAVEDGPFIILNLWNRRSCRDGQKRKSSEIYFENTPIS